MTDRKSPLRILPLLIALTAGLLALTAFTQTTSAQQSPTEKPLAFDTVSIHRDSSSALGHDDVHITPDGWHMGHASLMAALLTAYVPTTPDAMMYTVSTLAGLPDWMKTETYTIDAKVSESDLAAWQNPVNQPAMLRAMVQSMLTDRCKLAIHRGSRETTVYLLLPGKTGAKLEPSTSATTHAGAAPLPGGGEFLPNDGNGTAHFYNAPVAALAVVLSNVAGRPVEDRTGLTGRYDISLRRPRLGAASMDADSTTPTLFEVVEGLGLKLESGKVPVETLFVDHIERPSEN